MIEDPKLNINIKKYYIENILYKEKLSKEIKEKVCKQHLIYLNINIISNFRIFSEGTILNFLTSRSSDNLLFRDISFEIEPAE